MSPWNIVLLVSVGAVGYGTSLLHPAGPWIVGGLFGVVASVAGFLKREGPRA